MRDRTLTNERGDLMEAGVKLPRARPQLARGLWGWAWSAAPPTLGRLGHRGRRPGRGSGGSSGKRLVKARLWSRGPETLWGTWTGEPRDLPICQQQEKLCQGAPPQGQRPGGPGRSQVRPAGPASRVNTWKGSRSLRFNSDLSDIGAWSPDPVPAVWWVAWSIS